MQIRYSNVPLGAEITGLDLGLPVDRTTFWEIEKLLHDRGVIVFRDQKLTEDQHVAFSRRFGELEIHVAAEYLLPGHPEILVVSNIIENGRQIGLADAGQYWHSDLSYMDNPSRCSLLYALEVPIRNGIVLGETLFASAAYAYDTLPEPVKLHVAGFRATHRYGDRYKKQQAAGGRSALAEEQLKKVPDVSHPVVRPHPLTGQNALFVNEGFTVGIEGMAPAESDAFLKELFRHITRPESLYRHQWRKGDLLTWDNGLTQHLAIRNYEMPLRRLMHRTTVAGVQAE